MRPIWGNRETIYFTRRKLDIYHQLDLVQQISRHAHEARAAERLPWEPKTVVLYRTIFPQMTNWLPDEEGAQLRFEFETEIKRLEAA
jgi:hypothetical protein